MAKIAPSILSANFANLKLELDDVKSAGATRIHADVMDGVFVPNISIGLPVIRSVRGICGGMELDTHLMITRPVRYALEFCRAGSDIVTFHVESDEPEGILAAIEAVRSEGRRVGLSLKPATDAEALLPYIGLIDEVLVMTVEPGFGGQSFMHGQLPKIARLRSLLNCHNLVCEIAVDGGIDGQTAPLVLEAGATILIAGNAVFGSDDRAKAIKSILGA